MQEHAGTRTREAHEEHLRWLRTQWADFHEHMRAGAPASNSQGAGPSSSVIQLDTSTGSSSTEDEFCMPVYRSLGSLAVSDEASAATRDREAGLPQYSGSVALPFAEAAAEAAEQAWISDMRPPLVKRQRAFERTSI